MIARAFHTLGAPPRLGRHQPRRRGRSSGASTGSPTIGICRAGDARSAALLQTWGERPSRDSERVLRRHAGRRLRARRRRADVHERGRHAASREQSSSARATFPIAPPRGRRRAVVVLPQWNADAEGHVGLCRLLNRFGISRAAPEPSVSRRADAARAHARRLHRQLEHRTDGAGLPAGGARRAARDRVAARARATSRSASSARAWARAWRC